MTRPVVAEVDAVISAPLDTVWRAFVPIDLRALFEGKGPLPAVTEVSNQTGPWDVVGQTRNVTLSDGGRLTEEITGVSAPNEGGATFDYVVRGYSGFIGFLTDEGRGHWSFAGDGQSTKVFWRYTFRPRSTLRRPVLAAVGSLLWRGYMADALEKTRRLAETEATAA